MTLVKTKDVLTWDFELASREEFHTMVKWCQREMGRSHDRNSDWYVYSGNLLETSHVAKHGRHVVIRDPNRALEAILIWGT